MKKLFLLIFLLALALSGCTQATTDQPAAKPQSIAVSDPWIRAVPPNASNSAAYMRLENPNARDQQLVGASTSIAETVEIHNIAEENGMMRMFPVDEINIPANGAQALTPGGFHLMLIGLKQPLERGQEVQLELEFADQSKQIVTAEVGDGSPMQSEPHGQHGGAAHHDGMEHHGAAGMKHER